THDVERHVPENVFPHRDRVAVVGAAMKEHQHRVWTARLHCLAPCRVRDGALRGRIARVTGWPGAQAGREPSAAKRLAACAQRMTIERSEFAWLPRGSGQAVGPAWQCHREGACQAPDRMRALAAMARGMQYSLGRC